MKPKMEECNIAQAVECLVFAAAGLDGGRERVKFEDFEVEKNGDMGVFYEWGKVYGRVDVSKGKATACVLTGYEQTWPDPNPLSVASWRSSLLSAIRGGGVPVVTVVAPWVCPGCGRETFAKTCCKRGAVEATTNALLDSWYANWRTQRLVAMRETRLARKMSTNTNVPG